MSAKMQAARNAMIARVLVCSTFQVSVSVRSLGPAAEAARAERPDGTFSSSRLTVPSPLACLNHMSEEASCWTRSADDGSARGCAPDCTPDCAPGWAGVGDGTRDGPIASCDSAFSFVRSDSTPMTSV